MHKLFFISHNSDRSGAPQALLQELRILKNKYPDIHLIVFFLRNGELIDDFKKIATVISRYDFRFRIIRKFRLEKTISRLLHIDCIYANSILSVRFGTFLKKKCNIPLIAHIHESESIVRSHIASPNDLEGIDHFIVVSQLAANNLIENWGVDNNKITTQKPFSPWVDAFFNGKIELPANKTKGNRLNIGIIANGSWQKSIDIIPLIVYEFSKRYPFIPCLFTIVGVTLEEDATYRLLFDLKRMGIEDKVNVAGRVNNPLNILSTFDIFLLTSREDSFPLVAEEAALMKKPIIGFNGATGATEWITQFDCGILVPFMNLEALSDAIFSLAQNVERRQSLGNRAFGAIKKLFEDESQMKNVIGVIEESIPTVVDAELQ